MTEMQHHAFQQQLSLARLDERKHIAHELHDQVIQDLVGLQFQLSAVRAGAETGQAQQLASIQDQVRRLIHKTRQLCGHMRTTVFGNGAQRGTDLVQAARAWLDSFAATCAFRLSVHVEGSTGALIDPDAALCIFRVLQEALVNVQKHARAQSVVITIHICPDGLSLHVQDDGVGFCTASAGQLEGHFGLLGMRERLERLGGSFEVWSAPGQGTAIAAWAPCHHPSYQEHSTTEAQHATV
ncbi:MAG TPA: sensor histidine kinase [Roseiflexaceae bacterium]|nr:sensor histidine kinase [Roseiflexaceae bacterium]